VRDQRTLSRNFDASRASETSFLNKENETVNSIGLLGRGALGALLVSLSACSQTAAPQGSQSPSDVRVVMASPDSAGVSVVGRGETTAPPDTGFFDVGVEVDAPSVALARDGAAKAADRVIGALARGGVDKKDIQTNALSVMPRMDYTGQRERIVGYSVHTSVMVKVRKLDNIGKLVDDSLAAGGNAARISGVRFGFEDPTALRDKAREQAVADARRKAEQLARLSGVTLTGPISVEETQFHATPPPMVTLEGADATRMPIERGTGLVAVDVKVRWGIKG
jgi:uncharacterized protein YggE